MPPSVPRMPAHRPAWTAFAEEVRQGGFELLPTEVAPAPSTIMAGREAVRRLLPHLDRRTAMCCSSDLLAFGAVTEARMLGIAVPDRLAVCGFGNFELGAACEPPISTVNVEGGRSAAPPPASCSAASAAARAHARRHVPFHIVERATS